MKVLLLLAHADDETLGVGGTVQQLVAAGHDLHLLIGSSGVVILREEPSDNRASLSRACGLLCIENWHTLGLPDQGFETRPVAEIAQEVWQKISFTPDLIITHSRHDLNRDHRIMAEVAHIIGRPRGKPISILGCEIPCVGIWHGRAFSPDFYVGLSRAELSRKIEAFGFYETENRAFPDPYSAEGLRILAHQRGMESGYEAAEAFEVLRWYPQHGWHSGAEIAGWN